MMKSALATCLLLLAAMGSIAQSDSAPVSSTSEDKTSSIEGIVVKDPGEQPLKKATVEVVPEDEGAANYTAISDAEGHFRISAVQPGRYRIFVERTGFIEVDKSGRRLAGTALSIEAGHSTKDLELHMLTAAILTGRVVDEDGDPMANVEISVLRYGYSSGRRELEQERSERTNDLGEFRIPGLLAGRYFVSASPAPDFSTVVASKPRAQDPDKTETGYVTTYYPGANDLSQAVPLELHPGDEVPIDFTLVRTRTFRVRGSVANLASSRALDSFNQGVVMLHPKEFNNEVFSAAEVDKNGNFEIRGIAPGAYTITLMRRDGETAQVSHQELVVANSDVNHVRLVPMQDSQIRGQLRIENGAQADLTSLAVILRPVSGPSSANISSEQGQVKPDGSFELSNVSPGKYTVSVSGGTSTMRDYFLKKLIAGGRDISDSDLVVPGGTTLSMSLLISASAASLEGTVVNEQSQPLGSVTVVAVPDASHQDQLDRYRRSMTDQRGHFLLRGLTPGHYTVFAWQHVEEGAYYDPDFLKQYEASGEKLQVVEGDRRTLRLKALAPPD
jgi:protocatechuate 3,4-dioxygenase beta subunit